MALTKVSRGLLSTSIEDNGNATAITIDSSENVGIGTSSPSRELEVTGSGNVYLKVTAPTSSDSAGIELANTGATWLIQNVDYSSDALVFSRAGTERMRIDSSGNLLVGTTDSNPSNNGASGNAGIALSGSGYISAARSSESVGLFNRMDSDGSILLLRKDGVDVGSIGVQSAGTMFIAGSSSQNTGVRFFNTGVAPCNSSGDYVDNSRDLGASSVRWDDVYATNGTIQTSDRNEKQDIAELSEAEQRVAVACKGLMRKFRWKDSVVEKGDDARIHFGIIAQDLQAAFEAEGLDAGDYAMFISTTWWEQDVEVPAVEAVDAVYETQTDEEGNETQVLVQEAVEAVDAYTRTDTFETAEEAPEGATERTRLGVRYSELLAFIISAL